MDGVRLCMFSSDKTNIFCIVVVISKQKFIRLTESLAIDINTLKNYHIKIEGALSFYEKKVLIQI